ncbi:hypothetical protein [Sphingomonas solaris]|uniref:Uncharacterized protein n=1 Tax=Alterirhizorhabdus solaris TaxID=2529389 RepID=A0A558RBM1_9SPHN|nr:hypothetical protein [Sphingomonas solaris]TVV76774.1 hypothetical protein FOY91_03465 [Sphingomonas solaris]
MKTSFPHNHGIQAGYPWLTTGIINRISDKATDLLYGIIRILAGRLGGRPWSAALVMAGGFDPRASGDRPVVIDAGGRQEINRNSIVINRT